MIFGLVSLVHFLVTNFVFAGVSVEQMQFTVFGLIVVAFLVFKYLGASGDSRK